MPLTLEQLAKAVISAGLSSSDEMKTFWSTIPAAQRPKDAKALAELLVKREKLTKFQAQELFSGGSTPLVLGDYVLLSRIGAGGMGQVFKAQHRHMKRLVAIKLLPASLTKDEAAVKRFQREVEAAARLSHPNIVQAHDAGVQRGVWYLVMELVEGKDLAAISTQQGQLPIPLAIDFIRQAARGLAYAHENGVVHRDIKPANLLLDKKGNIKILDMGLARFDSAANAAAQEGLTQSGQVMGTVDYMAPEQAFDTKTADARSDVYSLGCTLFRLLAGRNLFEGETLVQKLMAHQSQPVPSLSDQRPDASAGLVAVFERMVAKRPDDRYQSLAEVDADLAAVAAGGAPGSSSSAGQWGNDAAWQSFLGTMGDATSAGMSVATQGKTVPAKSQPEHIQTVNLSSPQSGTDPVSSRSIQIARDHTAAGQQSPKKLAKAASPPLWKKPPVLIAAGVGGLLVLLFAVWLVIKDKKGKEVGKFKVPAGGTVEIKPDPNKTPPKLPPTVNGAGSLPLTQAGRPNESGSKFALHFDGQGVVETGEVPLLPSNIATLEAWLTSESKEVLLGFLIELPGCQALKQETAGYTFYTFHGHIQTNDGVEVRRRVHLAGVNDGRQRRLYLNGKLIAKLDEAGHPNPEHKPGPMRIGQRFLGKIDAVRVSTIARYTGEFTPPASFTPDKDTFALYRFDEGQGDVLKDSSGNNRHGKINGAKWVRLDGSAIPAQVAAAKEPGAASTSSWQPAKCLDATINVGQFNSSPWVSPDGLELWQYALQAPPAEPEKLTEYLAVFRRKSVDASWGTATVERSPIKAFKFSLTADGLFMALQATRDAPIQFAWRTAVDKPWSEPKSMPPLDGDLTKPSHPVLSPDGLSLYVARTAEAGGSGGDDIWVYTHNERVHTWSQPTNLGRKLNSPAADVPGSISADGKTLVFSSRRDGGHGDGDIWISRRETSGSEWGPPENLGPSVNSSAGEFDPFLSADGQTLWFIAYHRNGNVSSSSVWEAKRESPVTSSPTFDVDRTVARWLLDHDIPFELEDRTRFTRGDPLPAEPFSIYQISSTPPVDIPREEAAAFLKELRQLKKFSGGYLPLRDADRWAEAYSEIPAVTQVNAYGSDISDRGVELLARLPNLHYLNFEGCYNVTRLSLAHLAKCPSLDTVEFDQRQFQAGRYTLSDLQALQDALPRCRFMFSGQRTIPGLKKPAAPAP